MLTVGLITLGDPATMTPDHDRGIARLGELRDRVVRHGPCNDTEIGRLHRSADFFVLPSRRP